MKLTINFAKFFLAICFFTLRLNYATATEGDYDGDGLSDIVIIDADKPENKTTVYVRYSSNTTIGTHSFKPYGDAVVHGNFFGNGKTYPGIVANLGSSKGLEWHIKSPSGDERVYRFGSSGDTVPNQGDLDCDGITDSVVVRSENGRRTWFARMSSDSNATHHTVFGGTEDMVFTNDMNGDGCSEIVTLSPSFEWRSKSFFSNQYNAFKWGSPGEIPLLPKDLNGDGILEYIVVGILPNVQVAYVHSLDGGEYVIELGGPSAIPMVGNFFGRNTLGWFNRSYGNFDLHTPYNSRLDFNFGNSNRGLLRPDGTVVFENESGVFGNRVIPSSGGGNNSGSNSDNSGDLCDREIKGRDGSGGFKNNPKNSKGTMKIIFPNSMTGKIREVDVYRGDNKFDDLNHKVGNEWGDRERYYGTRSLSSYPKDLTIVARMKDGSNTCVSVPDPKKIQD